MPNVLVRNVPAEDLELLRSAAAERGESLQNYLLDAVQAQAAYLRRQEALIRIAERLDGEPVPDEEREAVLNAIEDAHVERAGRLADRAPK